MAWRRLLCVGFGAGFLSISQGALSVENAPPVADAELMPDDQVGESNAPKTFSHVELNLALVKADSSTRSEFQSYRRERKIGQVGYASWYGSERHGNSTASGERFDKNALTAAHRTLPLHSNARVTNMTNGRSVTVRITDRGPARRGRIIDLSQSAAEEIGMRGIGVARVQVEPIVADELQ